MAQHKQQKRSKKNAPKHARVSDVSKNSPSLGVVASVALASTLAIAPFSAAHALEAAASQAPDATDNAPTPQSKAPAKAAAPHAKQVSFTVRDSDSNILPPLSVFAVDTKTPSPEKPSITPAVAELRSAVTRASGEPAASTPASGSVQGSQPGSQPAPAPGAGDTSSSSPSTPTGAPDASTNKNAVITPNTNNTEANTQEGANAQVKREEDNKKTYTLTVSYCVEGYHQKQLLQPTEFTFTDDELTKISDPHGEGLYIPVKETKGYKAQRGNYIKDGDKYVLDTKKDASVQSYIKIDRTLVEANINNITSTDTNKIAHYFIEYRPKTVTYYVRHMIQDPDNPDKFKEYSQVSDIIDVNNAKIHVSKTKGVVGQSLYAQPINIEGYSPEPNLVNSPIPDDDDYVDADADNPSSANNKKKYLVLELRYLLNKHEVSYDTQGGTAIQSKVFYYGMKVDAVPTPLRKGYKLTGWKKLIKKNAHAQNPSDPQTPGIAVNSTLLEQMPDYDVRFVAQWKPEKEQAEYHINIWVQKADLPKPDDPTNMDNYDFVGQVQKEGKSDGIIQDTDLNLTDDQIAHLAWPDKNLRGNIENQTDFDKYFMEDQVSEAKTQALNNVEEPEYFGATKKRPLMKIRPDGTTVVNKVFNRRVYELIFAHPDIVKDGKTYKIFTKNGTEQYDVDHFTITKGGKEYNGTDKNNLYKVRYRFGQTIHYTSGFPTDTETKRYQTADDSTPLFGLGWRVANDAEQVTYIDTPPYRFDVKYFIAPQPKGSGAFSQDNIRLFGEELTPYQRVLVPDANASSSKAGPIHVLVKLETEESARRNDDSNREYVASELSYTKDDTLSTDYDYGAPTIEGFEPLKKTQRIEKSDEDDYYEKLAEELTDVWKKDHSDEDDPDGSDEDFRNWVAEKFPQLVFTRYGSDGSEFEENSFLIFEYKRKKASVNFVVDQVTPIQNAGTQASTQESFGTNLKKFATDYNDAVKKNDPAKGKQFASSYTFTIDGKTYTFKRPDSLPEDYEFAGWSLDPAGTQKLTPRKKDGTPYTSQEIEQLRKRSPEEFARALGIEPEKAAALIDKTPEEIAKATNITPAEIKKLLIKSPQEIAKALNKGLYSTVYLINKNTQDIAEALNKDPDEVDAIIKRTPEEIAKVLAKTPEDEEKMVDDVKELLNRPIYDIAVRLHKTPEEVVNLIYRPIDEVAKRIGKTPEETAQLIYNTPEDIAEALTKSPELIEKLLKRSPEEFARALGNTPLETGGITLYASWKRVDTTHTIDVDMGRDDAPEHTLVKVKHGEYAKTPSEKVQDGSDPSSQGRFPKPSPRDGYIFNGWLQKYTRADGTEQWLPFAFTSPILEDLKIKAQWIEDKRVKGTVSHIFLRPGYTVDQYKQAKTDNNTELLKKMIADEQVNTISNLRPRSSYAAEAAYRNDNYYPDHTYSTFVVSDNKDDNHAEFIYTPYATRRYTVHYKDAAGNELAAPEVFVSNKLSYDVAHAKVISGYRLPNDKPLARQLNFTDSKNKEAYIKPDANGNYSVEFIYDDVRILKRKDNAQVTPANYSRVQFDTQTTELTMENGKVKSNISNVAGGDLSPYNGTKTGDVQHSTDSLTFDIVKGTKAFEAPLPVPHAKEGYTFTGWTSKVVYAAGDPTVDGVNRLPVFSEEFPYKVVYTAHFTKTQIAFVGGDSTTEAPKGYYKVTYSADQNGRLQRVVPDGHGGTKTETLDTLTNVVVVDKYKDNVIEAPTAVPDTGFVEKGDFEFKGRDSKDRSYVKHFVMIDPIAAEHRYILPDESVLKTNETAKDLIKNYTAYKNQKDDLPGELAEYRFLDEKGNPVTKLDSTTPGEHKVFIEVIAGRAGQRVHKKVPYFYTVMPRSFLQGELSKYNADVVAAHYKKYTFKSRTANGIMTGRETAQTEGDYETLAAYVYAGTAAAPVDTYKLDVPLAAGHDFETKGYHYVFRGWKKVDETSAGSAAPDTLPADFKWKTFTPDIGPKDHYKDIKPTDDAAYVAMYEKIPYIVQKSEDGTVPPDSVVVSFKPSAGRAWKDGSTGPKVLYIKKGMDISKLDEHGVPIKPGETKKSILQVLGEKLYGYTGDWTKSSMDGITLIENMSTGAGADGWKSNNAFQEFVAHQEPYTDPVGGVEKTIVQGTEAPAAIDFVQNKNVFVPSETSTVESITAEYVKAPSTDAAANLTVPIKVTVKYKDSADATHTREYNITGSLHVLSDVLKSDSAPSDPALKDKYTTITFVSKKQDAPLKSGQTVADKEDPGQVSGATEGADQSELQYLAYKKTGAKYTIAIPQVTGKDYTANGYHYVFTGWKKVQSGAHAQEVLVDASQRTLSFDAEENVVYEAQYKKVPYITTKTDDGSIPDDSVVAAFKPAPGRTWKDGTNGPKTFYVKKGQDVHNLPFDIEENGHKKHYKSIIDYFKDQLYDNTGWSKSSMEDVQGIESVGESDWIANNAFQEYVAKQTDYTLPVLGKAQTIIQGTTIPDPETFVSNIAEMKNADNVADVKVSYTETPTSTEAANYTVPLKVTVTYKDSASQNKQKVYNLVGYLNVLGDVLEKKNAPSDPSLTNQYTTITFVSKKQKVVDASGQETGKTEDPGQVSGATESADNTQSELEYLTFKKDGASYTIDVPKVSGKDYTENGYHYVFTGWKQVVTPASGVTPVTIGAADRNYTFDAKQNIVFEAQYKKVPYIVTKVTDGTIPEDSVVVSFKPAPGRKWADGSTGPKVLYIKKGMDISRLDKNGVPIKDTDTTTQSILQVLGSQLAGYENDWSKSSMDGITLIKSMKEGAGADGWKSNNAFQEFVAHQKPHTKPETIDGYQAIIQNTTVPTPNDFIKNDKDLKDLLMKNGVVVPGKENIESYKVEFVGEAPKSKIAGTYLVPLKVTIKYRDMDSEDVFMLNSQLKVIYNVLYGKNKPTQDKLPIDFKVFDGHYRKLTFITDDNEKRQHKGTIIGETKNFVDYYLANDQDLKARVPKILNQDYVEDGYHYKFVGWKLVPSADTSVKDDKNELGAGDIKFGTSDADTLVVSKTAGDLIYKAVYEKINYIETHPVDGTVPADSVVVAFKPAPGRKWLDDGTTGPKVFYIKKDMDISRLDKNGVPIKPGDTTTESILQYLSKQLFGTGTTPDWSKSSMDKTKLIDSMNDAHKNDSKAWYAKDAFQEFVAHQKAVVDPTVKNEIVITQYGDVPSAKDFIDNMKALEGDNIARKADGTYDIEVHYGENDQKTPSSDAAGVYTVPIFITVKHADMADPIVYKLTSVLRVMDKVLSSKTAGTIVENIEKKQKEATPGTEPAFTPEEKQFKENYAKVVFSSGDGGTLVGGESDTTATHYVKKDTNITLDTPTVIAKKEQTFKYVFTGWKLQITPASATPASSQGSQDGTQPGSAQTQPAASASTRAARLRRSLDGVLPFTTLVQTGTPTGAPQAGGTPTGTTMTDIVLSNKDLDPENLPNTLRMLEAKYGKTFTNATYTFVAQYKEQPYILDSSQQDTVPEGYVPLAFLPGPKHTWKDGSTRPYIFYIQSGTDITQHKHELEAKLSGFIDWQVYDKNGALIENADQITAANNPKHAYTLIAHQTEVPNITPKDDVVIGVYDEVPNYDKLIRDIKQGDTTIPGLEAFMKSDRFAGFAAPSTELQLNPNASRPGVYVVHFGLNYKDDTGKIQTKDIAVNIRVLPRVIAAQNAPAAGTPEDTFIKENYTKVMYRVAMGDHGFLASPYTTFYVRRGYTIDPNALLYFDKKLRAERAAGNEEIGVPSTIAQPGYEFYDWQKVDANDKGDVVYLAHFHKLPIAHFEFETSTEAEQPFSTRLIGDAQNHPIYKPKPGTKLPDGITVTCDGATCTISGTPHITDWAPGETEREIELRFEAVDQRVTYDEHGKEQPGTDKYGRSSYGIQKEIVVKLVVKRPPEKTDDGAGSGGGYWYPKDGRYNHEPERSIVREVPGSKGGDQLVPASDQPPAGAQPNAHPAFENGIGSDNDELPGICSTARTSDKGCYYAGQRAPRHAKEQLPKTSDVPSHPLLELVAGSGIALIGTAFIAKRKKKNKHTK